MQTFLMTYGTETLIASLMVFLVSSYLWLERTLPKSLTIEVIDHIPAEEMIVPEIITPDLLSNVSDEEIEAAFINTNSMGCGYNYRERLTKSVLKVAVGYHCGNTITCIMRSLGLIGQHREGRLPVLTKKGQEYLQTALHKQL